MDRELAGHTGTLKGADPRRNITRELAVSGLFAALIAAGAFIQVTIPVQPYPVHVTMQWFFVLLAGLLLEPKLAAASVGTYLIIGLCGVPVFASGGGPAYLLRPTFGFLLGFLAAAYGMGRSRQVLGRWIGRNGVTGKKGESDGIGEAGGAGRISGSSGAGPRFFAALLGLAVYYGIGGVYFYVICNYVIAMPVAWKVVLVQTCLTTVGADFLLCLLAVAAAGRMRPVVARMMEN